MKILLFLITSAVILIVFFATLKSLTTAAKVLLLVSQEFPQIPFKPLHKITQKPKIEKMRIGKKIVADLFIPHNTNRKPAIIVAMGVKTSDKDKPVLLSFCDTLARLGYVVLWPRSEDLEKDKVKFEEPQTFIDSFEFLEERSDVNKNRISYVGLSVGSSLALVASEDSSINKKVHGLVFFGGYYNIIDYLTSLATKTMVVDGREITWEAHKDGINHAKEILQKEGLKLENFATKEVSGSTKERMIRFSPDQKIESYKAPIFILHERSDTFVPYTESIKLKQALEGKVSYAYYQANLFEHVQPKKGVSFETLKKFLGLFGFLHKVFMYL